MVREILRVLPSEKVIYIGDTARVPWGTRGEKIIVDFSRQLTSFLLKKKVKIIIVACHTASSVAFPSLKKEMRTPLLGVIEPSLKEAIKKSKKGRIGLIGTPATIKANAWAKALKKENPQIKLFSVSCPLLVPLVEEGLINHQVTQILAKEYLQPLVEKRIDTLILGCTHYPLLQNVIKEVVGNVVLVNPGKATVFALKRYLIENKLQADHKQPAHQFYFSDVSYQALNNLEMFSGKLGRVRIKGIRLEE